MSDAETAEQSCGAGRHARLGERPVGTPGKMGFWIDYSGRYALADAYVEALRQYLALCETGRPEQLPSAFVSAGAKVVAPSHGERCPAWKAKT